MRILNALGTVIIFGMLLIVVTLQMHQVIMRQIPPVTYESIRAENPVVKAGDDLRVLIDINRKRFCRTYLDIFIMSAHGNSVIARKSVVGGASELGAEEIKLAYPIPEDTPPGQYKYVTRGYYDCEEGMHVIHFPSVEFKVEK